MGESKHKALSNQHAARDHQALGRVWVQGGVRGESMGSHKTSLVREHHWGPCNRGGCGGFFNGVYTGASTGAHAHEGSSGCTKGDAIMACSSGVECKV